MLLAACTAEVGPVDDVPAVSDAYFDDGSTPDPGTATECGDGSCTGLESCGDCPGDCGVCDALCGNGTCDFETEDETCSSCAADCGACASALCGNELCDEGEDCASCPGDCGACDAACGDGECAGGETCAICPDDCGMCGDECPTCLLTSGIPASEPQSCGAAHYTGGRSCLGVRGAYRARSVNVGFYPFQVVRDTALYTGDPDPSRPERRRALTLRRGQGFDLQSTRNPGCRDSPPIRASVDGFVFGYKHATPNAGLTGWVRAADLEFVGHVSGRNCAAGPAGADFQVTRNPYDECRTTSCRSASGDHHHCLPNNARDEGGHDCDGARRVSLMRVVDAEELHLRYSPGGTSMRFLHRNDEVRVLLRIDRRGAIWDLVEVTRTSSPNLTPRGARGWTLDRWLDPP